MLEESLVILNESVRCDVMVDQLQLITSQEKNIPNSVEYNMRRFVKQSSWQVDDVGVLDYVYVAPSSNKNALKIRFCVSGQAYCNKADCSQGGQCKNADLVSKCGEVMETVDIYSFRFSTSYLSQFLTASKAPDSEPEKYLSFQYTTSASHVISVCNKSRNILTSLFNHNYSDTLENIYLNSQIQFLLINSLACLFGEADRDKVYQCKFLEDEHGRETIKKARELLLQHIGDPITIKDLARKVATNECYLKKGFREMFGTTIFDFYQGQRMEHAKFLLYEKGLSVTDVSELLGYSSISHFSTAFKKHTGLKPCELLIRAI